VLHVLWSVVHRKVVATGSAPVTSCWNARCDAISLCDWKRRSGQFLRVGDAYFVFAYL